MTTILDRFLESRKSLNTRSAYRVDILAFLARLDPAKSTQGETALTYPAFCRLSSSTLSTEIRRYLQTFEVIEPLRAYILNPRTINRKRAALSTFFSFLVTHYGYCQNPMTQFQTLSVRSKSTTDVLTEAEILEILAFMKRESEQKQTTTAFRDWLIILFLFRYALRRKELVSLTWHDFHPEQSLFHLIQKGNNPLVKPLMPSDWMKLCELRERYEASNDMKREGLKTRPMMTTKTARASVTKAKSSETRTPEKGNTKAKPKNAQAPRNPYVFHAVRSLCEKGSKEEESNFQPLTAGYVYKMVRSIAKILFPRKHITPHSFRGTFVGMSLNQNIEPGEIANATGHKSVKMVYYYDRRDPIEHNAIVKLSLPLT